MPKQYYVINDFSGGMNSRKNPKDIADNEFGYIDSMSIDTLGTIKTSGVFYQHKKKQDVSGDLTVYFTKRTMPSFNAGGYNLFYFESDQGRDSTLIEDTKHPGTSNALTIGTGAGNISFTRTRTNTDSEPTVEHHTE